MVVVVYYAATFRVVFLFVFWFWVVFCWCLACVVWRFFSLVCMARCRFWLLVGVMHVEYIFTGKDIQEKDVERAIDMSLTKYCGVTAMFSKAMEVTHSYRIESTD